MSDVEQRLKEIEHCATLDSDHAFLLAIAHKHREVLLDIRDNFDCDQDAHKYGTHCRACVARAALSYNPNESEAKK